jgi:hypothetical protein
MRISLRELMIVVAVAAVGLAGLKFASTWMLSVVQAMTGIFLTAFLVRAIVDRGRNQAFALGFVAAGLLYLASLGAIFEREGPKTPMGGFGTSGVLFELHSLVATPQWVDVNSLKIKADLQPTNAELNAGTAVRIELAPFTPEAGELQKETASASNQAEVETPAEPTSGAGRGRGRGRGRFTPTNFGNFPASLTPQQQAEYLAAESGLRNHYDNIIQNPQAQAALATGRPISSIYQRTYRHESVPRLFPFQMAGYCLFTLIVAYAGGHLAQYVYTRRTEQSTT